MKRKRKSKTASRNKAWRELSAQMRAGAGKCAVTGSTERLQVHHIFPRKQHPALMFERKNLIVLSARVHFLLHHGHMLEFMAWLEANRPEQWTWAKKTAAELGFGKTPSK